MEKTRIQELDEIQARRRRAANAPALVRAAGIFPRVPEEISLYNGEKETGNPELGK